VSSKKCDCIFRHHTFETSLFEFLIDFAIP
jgi:hypothetical protein